MILYATATLFFYTSALMLPYGSSNQAVSVNVSSLCEPSEKDCGFGCCPYAHGECCADGLSCCQNGQTCLSLSGKCIAISRADGWLTLSSSKSVPVRSLVVACPPSMTECGKNKCCRFPHATCCSDGQHCCPQGYSCDLAKRKCIKFAYNLVLGWMRKKSVPASETVAKFPFKSCPGGVHICPSYMSCCTNNAGEWSCCPNPELPQIRYSTGQCCTTVFGYICCPDDMQICTEFGCTF